MSKNKKSEREFNDKKLDAYADIIKELLCHGAKRDFDLRHPFDDATPRGLAKTKLFELERNEYLSTAAKEKMAAVLRLVAHEDVLEQQAVESQVKRQKC